MPGAQRVYVVRLWREPGAHPSGWRAVAADAASGQRHFFATPAALARFLEFALTPEAIRAHLAPPEPSPVAKETSS